MSMTALMVSHIFLVVGLVLGSCLMHASYSLAIFSGHSNGGLHARPSRCVCRETRAHVDIVMIVSVHAAIQCSVAECSNM